MKDAEIAKYRKMLGERIRKRREGLGLSQGKIADALGINQTKVSDIEAGKRRIDLIAELPILCGLLQRPVSWFISGDFEIEIQSPQDPDMVVINTFFPYNNFKISETRQLYQFLEKVLDAYLSVNPELKQRSYDESEYKRQTTKQGGGYGV